MAKNIKFDPADQLSVICTSPTSPVSGDPVRWGLMTGTALTDENADGETTVKFGSHVATQSVKGVNDSGNSAVADGDALFYVDADTPHLSKKSTGYFYGFAKGVVLTGATTTIDVHHEPAPGSGTLGTGTVGPTQLAANAVTAPKLTATLATGQKDWQLSDAVIISSNAIQNTTEGGRPDGNSSPSLARVNGATDICERLIWAAAAVDEIQFAGVLPSDVDDAATIIINLWIEKDTNTDTAAVVAVKYFQGKGDSNAGGNTAAISTATLTKYQVTIAAADVLDTSGVSAPFSIALVPGTHGTDAIRLYGISLEYTRK